MRPKRILISAITAPSAAMLIAVGLSVLDGVSWENPFGLIYYAVIFVAPFTLVGSFLVVLPAHFVASRKFDDGPMRSSIVLITSGLVGAMMLQLISNEAVTAALVGAASGLTTAILWLAFYSMFSRSFAND